MHELHMYLHCFISNYNSNFKFYTLPKELNVCFKSSEKGRKELTALYYDS